MHMSPSVDPTIVPALCGLAGQISSRLSGGWFGLNACESLEAEPADHQAFLCAADERLCPVDKAATTDFENLTGDINGELETDGRVVTAGIGPFILSLHANRRRRKLVAGPFERDAMLPAEVSQPDRDGCASHCLNCWARTTRSTLESRTICVRRSVLDSRRRRTAASKAREFVGSVVTSDPLRVVTTRSW